MAERRKAQRAKKTAAQRTLLRKLTEYGKIREKTAARIAFINLKALLQRRFFNADKAAEKGVLQKRQLFYCRAAGFKPCHVRGQIGQERRRPRDIRESKLFRRASNSHIKKSAFFLKVPLS